MIDMKAVENSQKQYEEVKAYFLSQNLSDCVIEISDKPMSDWMIHFTKTERQMRIKCIEYSCDKQSYISIEKKSDGIYFFYMDYTIRALELVTENKIISSDIVDPDEKQEIDINETAKELAALIKMLQSQ